MTRTGPSWLVKLLVVVVPLGLASGSSFAETLTVTERQVSDEKAVFATVESISVVPARGRIGGHYRLGWEEKRRAGKSLLDDKGMIELPVRRPEEVPPR